MDKAGIGQMLRRLTQADGPSGTEGRVAALVRELLAGAADEARTDALGNLIAVRRANASPPAGQQTGKIMLAAHMDEIGLIVTAVDRGALHVGRIGGVDARSLVGQEVTVYPTGPGAEKYPDGLPGYIGARPPHMLGDAERKQVVQLHDLRVDLGCESGSVRRPATAESESGSIRRPATAEMVRVGDRVAVRGPYTELLGGRVATKALDNRASVAAMIAALGYLAGMKHTWDVYAVATVQEEAGIRGAMTSAFGVAPDLAVAIDVTFGEQPGINGDKTVEMDKGPAIGWGPNLHGGIVKRLRETADALELPYVTEPLPGHSGTDAWAIQVVREGIPTGLLSIPIRYMHSAAELVALADIDRTARLLTAFISRLDATTLAALPDDV